MGCALVRRLSTFGERGDVEIYLDAEDLYVRGGADRQHRGTYSQSLSVLTTNISKGHKRDKSGSQGSFSSSWFRGLVKLSLSSQNNHWK